MELRRLTEDVGESYVTTTVVGSKEGMEPGVETIVIGVVSKVYGRTGCWLLLYSVGGHLFA